MQLSKRYGIVLLNQFVSILIKNKIKNAQPSEKLKKEEVEKVMDNNGNNLGNFIEEKRTACGISAKELSQTIGVSYPTILRIEKGISRRPTALTSDKKIDRLASALGCQPEDIKSLIPRKKLYPTPAPATKLGKIVWNLRREQDLYQIEVAKAMGFKTNSPVGLIEKDRILSLTPEKAKKLAKALNCRLSLFKPFVAAWQDKRLRRSESEFGALVRIKRQELELSQRALAKKVGLTAQAISWMEINGKGRLKPDILEKLAKTLRVEMATLLALKKPLKSQINN